MNHNGKFYGKPILSTGLMNVNSRSKNRFITRIQYKLLDFFGFLNAHGMFGRVFSRMSRKLVGGYLHSLKVEINSSCNLSCKMCYVPKSKTELEFPLLEKLVSQIRKSGSRMEIMGGEPLLRTDLPEIIALAKNTGRLPFVMVYTNGTMATKELSRQLKDAGLDAVIVTLISMKPAVHDEFTQVAGSWEKTVEGIRNLRDAEIDTYTFTAIHQVNKNEIREINEFVSKELKVEPLFYQHIPQSKSDPLILEKGEWYELKNMVLAAHPAHAAFVRDFGMLTGNACSGGNYVFTVKADGSVQPCPFISDLPLGNIRQDNMWKIIGNRYKGTQLAELKCLPESCKGCTYASVCGGGCRASNKMMCGTYNSVDFRCMGPYNEELKTEIVIDRLPCFF